MDKIVIFETFYNPIEASIVKSRLIDSGVQCFLSDEHMMVVNPLYNQALGGVKLHLFERDALLARQILEDENVQLPIEELESNTVTCPECSSNHVGYVQATKNRFSILTMLISFVFLLFPFYARKTHHCFNCENEF
ncbi:MAG TPA: LITAF-like zinc ribbon domain-containing protein [Pedobacter sp.]|nr:LITAF-like zinc ribbon domain-containing protein [Pedobacter sp.]